MAYQRSIEIAYDKHTGEQYDANTLFKTAKEGYEIRRRYNAGELAVTGWYCRSWKSCSEACFIVRILNLKLNLLERKIGALHL